MDEYKELTPTSMAITSILLLLIIIFIIIIICILLDMYH